MTARDVFIAGLRDAYAMEKQAKDMMESQASRLEDYPAIRNRAGQHVKETEAQIGRLEDALGSLGESPSTLKNAAMRAAGNMQAMVHSAATDEVIKDGLTGFAFEHFEIAAYRNLIVMAEALHEPQIADLCRQSLKEEEAMAGWLSQHMEQTARDFMQRVGAASESRASA